MTTQETIPLLPLDAFRQFVGYNAYHFWGCSNQTIPTTSQCNTVLPEYGYQNAQAISRSDLRDAIIRAETKLADYLRYDVAPRYREEVQPWPTRLDRITRRIPSNVDGEYLSVQARYGYVQAVGVETLTVDQANAAVVLTKSITPQDSFTVTAPTTATSADEVAIYFSAADRYDGSAVGPRWRIQPISVTIAAGIATITGPAWLLIRPTLYTTSFNLTVVDPTNNANFASTVDVARLYIDPDGQTVDTSQATLIWETLPWSWYCQSCTIGGTTNPYAADPAAVGKAIARVGVRDMVNGTLTPAQAVYSTTSSPPQWVATPFAACSEPDRVELRYRAGLALVNGQMSPFWAELVCILTLAELPGPICACKESNVRIAHWQFDLARTSGMGGESYGLISGEDLNNPFGTRRGHVEVWKRVRDFRQLGGLLL
jgi:hypothetical protein